MASNELNHSEQARLSLRDFVSTLEDAPDQLLTTLAHSGPHLDDTTRTMFRELMHDVREIVNTAKYHIAFEDGRNEANSA